MKPNRIHTGSLIQQKVKEKAMSVAQFARLINRSRGAVYHIYESESIDTELLRAISNVLDYDFITKHYVKTNSANTAADYVLITFLNEAELPDKLPENSILTKKTELKIVMKTTRLYLKVYLCKCNNRK
jgi:transcriptional regulator with XRE-family HTH domain